MDDIFSLSSGEESTRGSHGPLATHCDVPLTEYQQRAALLIPAPGQIRNERCYQRKEWKKILEYATIRTPHRLEFTKIQRFLLNEFKPRRNPLVEKELKQQEQIARELFKVNVKSLGGIGAELPPFKFDIEPEDKDCLAGLYNLKHLLLEAVLYSGAKHNNKLSYFEQKDNGVLYYKQDSVTFLVTRNLCYIEYQGQGFLGSRDHLLILSDLASERYMALDIAVLHKLNEIKAPTPVLLRELFENGDMMIEKGGNQAYKLIYSLEAECVSFWVGDMPLGHPTGATFQETMIADGIAEAESMGVYREWSDRFRLLRQAAQDPAILADIYGLYRLWGHPTVDPIAGTIELNYHASQVRFTDSALAETLNSKFKEEFVIRYIRREHKWPPLNIQNLGRSNLLRNAYDNNLEFPNLHKDYQRDWMEHVTFEKIFPVDPKFDIAEMIADKSLSLNLDDLWKQLRTTGRPGGALDRSVLISWMKSSLQDPEEFLKTIDMTGFPPAESCVGVKEKEREGKLKARLYGLMTLIKRTYIVLTEALLAEHILPYFPEITMTDDELQLGKKKLRFTTKHGEQEIIYTSADFKKWNSYMRKNETLPMFQSFDQLFGFKSCFSRTHEMFEGSTFYLLNGFYVPELIDGKFKIQLGTWTNHLGGIEGLRQKGWTIWTIILIMLAAENLPMQLHLMGQGDNQMMKEVYPEGMDRDSALTTHYRFIGTLDGILKRIGPRLKVSESWSSFEATIYGKDITVKGVSLGTPLKKMIRMGPFSNEDYPTIESAISSCTANYMAAMAASPTPAMYFYFYLKAVIECLQLNFRTPHLHSIPLKESLAEPGFVKIASNHGTTRKEYRPALKNIAMQTNLVYTRLLMHPRALGGLPILNLGQSLIRSFPDEVVLAVSTLRNIYLYSPSSLRSIILTILSPELNPEKNFELLLEHPTVLNIMMPPSPGDSRRNIVLEFLQTTPQIKNEYLREFLSVISDEESRHLSELLSQSDHLNPRVLSLVYGSSSSARARQVVGRLQKTKIISVLAVREGGVNILRAVRLAELNHLRAVLRGSSRYKMPTCTWDSSRCSTTWVEILRETGWGQPVEGVNCVSPFEIMTIELYNLLSPQCSEIDLPMCGYIDVRLPSNMSEEELRDPYQIGQSVPYRGSTTRQKTTGYGDKLAAMAEPLIKKALRCMSLIGWACEYDSNLSVLIKELVRTRTDIDPDTLLMDEDSQRGSVHHRANDERTGHGGVIVVNKNYGTKMFFNSFPLTEYSKGGINVTLQFQSLMCISSTVIGWMLERGVSIPSRQLHIHLHTLCCVRPVDESMIEIPARDLDFLIYRPDSQFLYSRCRQLLEDLKPKVDGLRIRDLPPGDENLTIRMNNALAEEIFHLLDLTSWNRQTQGLSNELTMNWVFRAQLIPTLEILAWRILTYFFTGRNYEDVSKIIFWVAERVSASPVVFWETLFNMIQMPDFHHELRESIYGITPSGEPTVTKTRLGGLLRRAVATILRHWAVSEFPQEVLTYPIYSRTYASLFQRPSGIELTRVWVRKIPRVNCLTLRMKMFDPSNQMLILNPKEKEILERLNARDLLYLTNEPTDVISKRAPKKTRFARTDEINEISLPEGSCFQVLSFSQDDLSDTRTDQNLQETRRTQETSYELYQYKSKLTISSGAAKLYTLLSRIEGIGLRIACLADGAGGFSWGFLHQSPNCEVFYNTLIHYADAIQQAPAVPHIPMLSGYPSYEDRVIGWEFTQTVMSDILNPLFIPGVRKQVAQRFDGVTCDAEWTQDDPGYGIKIARAFVKFSITFKTSWGILKTFLVNEKIMTETISLLLRHYRKVTVLRSYLSSSGNREVYLMCTQGAVSLVSKYMFLNWTSQERIILALETLRSTEFPNSIQVFAQVLPLVVADFAIEEESAFLTNFLRNLTLMPAFQFPRDLYVLFYREGTRIPGSSFKTSKDLKGTKLSVELIRRWTIPLLAIWLTQSSDPAKDLAELQLRGSIIWYRSTSGNWSITTGVFENLSSIAGDNAFVYLYTEILTSDIKKSIFKLMGILGQSGLLIDFKKCALPPDPLIWTSRKKLHLMSIPKNKLLRLQMEGNFRPSSEVSPMPNFLPIWRQKEKAYSRSIRKRTAY